MAGDTYLTVSGNLTAIPKSGVSRSGSPWARLRVATTSRVFDRGESQWRDGDTMFLDVMCWRRLAENVVATLERGDRVLVCGRLRQRSYEDQQGARHTVMELEAESVGPDLTRTPARLLRPASDQQEPAGAAPAVPEEAPPLVHALAVGEPALPEAGVRDPALAEAALPEVAVAV
jgi:single-strand DNA-binding protein